MTRPAGNSSNGRTPSAILELEGIRKSYPLGSGTVEVLHGISVRIEAGKLVAIVGPSGSGKSTLLNLLGSLDTPSEGRLRFGGRDIGGLGEGERTKFRAANLGFVFQFFNLLPGLSARQNVELAAAIAGMGRRDAHARAGALLEEVGLSGKLDTPARNLSGGQMQRVAIARALVNEPRLVLADEPTGNLDQHNAAQILELLREQANGERAVVMVTHDHDLASRFADETISLVDGEVDAVTSGGPGNGSNGRRRSLREAISALARR
jgi:ABC-type lipoprotein export system ATPase subunit